MFGAETMQHIRPNDANGFKIRDGSVTDKMRGHMEKSVVGLVYYIWLCAFKQNNDDSSWHGPKWKLGRLSIAWSTLEKRVAGLQDSRLTLALDPIQFIQIVRHHLPPLLSDFGTDESSSVLIWILPDRKKVLEAATKFLEELDPERSAKKAKLEEIPTNQTILRPGSVIEVIPKGPRLITDEEAELRYPTYEQWKARRDEEKAKDDAKKEEWQQQREQREREEAEKKKARDKQKRLLKQEEERQTKERRKLGAGQKFLDNFFTAKPKTQ